MDLSKVIEPLIKSRHVTAFTNRNGEVGTVAVDQLEGHLGGAGVNMGVKGKFRCGEMFSPIFLTLVTEEMKILLYFLVFALNFAVSFRMIGSSEASLNTKTFIESTHKLSRKLRTAIREDFLRDSVKAEDIPVVKIGSTLSR
jgi:hypothetical protein